MDVGGQVGRIAPHAIQQSLDKLQAWVERHDYRGYEPFDGLSSWVRPLLRGNLLGERLLQQLIRQSPLNLRPILGVKPQDSTKGRGYMASGYVLLYRVSNRQEYLDRALGCLEWLDRHKAGRFKHHSWSNHFDFSSRFGKYTRDDPIIVWTALIGHAFLDAFEVSGAEWLLRVAESAGHWICELPREETASGSCISYLAHTQHSVHNANMLGAGFLARAAKHTASREFLSVARSAMEYSCTRQREDGSWWYTESQENHWIDNFHTGYNLDSLKHYLDATDDSTYRKNFERGLDYYKRTFFEASGCPKYYHDRTYPIDIQCAAQAIDTLSFVSEDDPEALDVAERVASWTIRNMQDRQGYFYFRRYPLVVARTPMLHWGQATMFKALAHLLTRLRPTVTRS